MSFRDRLKLRELLRLVPWASEFEHHLSTTTRKGTSAQNHEKSKFSSRKLWVYFEQQKSVRVCFAQRLSMFNASSSKSNSSIRGTLHFTRQPRSCEVAPTLRQFHFQTSVSGIIMLDVLKMIVCQWSQMNAMSRLMGISEQQKIVFCALCASFCLQVQ